MTGSHIRLFPDPVLRKKCEPVRRFGAETKRLFEKMTRIMKVQQHGIGIAAPQIGIAKAMAVIDLSERIPGASRYWIANPKIVSISKPVLNREGCMSLPNYMGNTKRYEFCRVRWQDECGEFHEAEFSGIEAICFQHEIDHLDGRLFLDRVTSLKTDMIPRSWKSKPR